MGDDVVFSGPHTFSHIQLGFTTWGSLRCHFLLPVIQIGRMDERVFIFSKLFIKFRNGHTEQFQICNWATTIKRLVTTVLNPMNKEKTNLSHYYQIHQSIQLIQPFVQSCTVSKFDIFNQNWRH